MPLEDELNKGREKHDKAWGYEEWLVNSKADNLCGKILILHSGMHCSMHYHKIKTEFFYVKNGLVYMEFDDKKGIMKPTDTLLIKPNQRHRFTGLTEAEIIEFSTFHRDDDSYRKSKSGSWTQKKFRQICNQYEQELKRFYLEPPPAYCTS